MAKPLPHQTDGVRKALPVLQKSKGFYLAWDPGMGKTLGFIALARMLGARRVLVLAPVVALGVWEKEIEKWWPGAHAVVMRDTTWRLATEVHQKMRRATHTASPGSTSPHTVITNYDQLTGKTGKRRLERVLLKMNFDLLILDEAHMVKTPTSQRTRAAMKLAARIPYKILGSGTPSHSPLDWWSQFRIIAPYHPMWAQRFGEYKKQIAIMGGPTGNWVKSFNQKAKERAIAALAPYVHVARVSELALPEPIFTVVPVILSANERAAYRQMEDLFYVEIQGTEVMSAQIVLTKVLRLQQITSGHLQELGVQSTKLAAVTELLEQRIRQKVIVAARFDYELDQLEAILSGRRVLVIRGGVPYGTRKDIETSFQNDPEPGVLLLNYQAGGMALTLTRADAMILYSIHPSLIQFQQVIGRVYRIGTTTHVQVLPLLARDTVDEDIYAGLIRKDEDENLARLVVDGMRKRRAA